MDEKLFENSSDKEVPPQRKTTLKWSDDGELSSIDMTRILSRLNTPDLTACEISCDKDTKQ
tara:strand:+ start:253 stop:435 length:183 start_codon:yes stop_codon:yes gene_type:complete